MTAGRLLPLALLAAVLAVGCGKKPEVSPAETPLARPVVTLVAKPGVEPKILIPRAALIERGGIPGVFVLSEAGAARFRMVRPGRVRDAQVEILSGLRGDETLVLGDLTAVHDGSSIRISGTADERR